MFFIAVKTTNIFCRPICPANAPLEKNVTYFPSAEAALNAGFRPCLRCHPESAPNSWRWQGVNTTVERALKKLQAGELEEKSLTEVCESLGVSDRYLRKLFQQKVGLSPKQFVIAQQLLRAREMLEKSNLKISDIAIACGFNSVRRFNDAFKKHMHSSPSEQRKKQRGDADANIQINLAFQPPFDFSHSLNFYRARQIHGVESVGDNSYSRSFSYQNANGVFQLSQASGNEFILTIHIDNIRYLRPVLDNIKRMFDVDAKSNVIDAHLAEKLNGINIKPGIRIPGIWSNWEAGVRAILGQQISVKAAITQLNQLVDHIHQPFEAAGTFTKLFPLPEQIAKEDLSFLRMPEQRKLTLKRLAEMLVKQPDLPPDEWRAIKGIGPWTIDYVKLRGESQPDVGLETDLIVKRVLANQGISSLAETAPWRSYASLQCWAQG